MSRIKGAFEGGKAFITFITCGDPDLATTKEIVLEAVRNGADIVELGIPFSDPTAEGPVIMAANERALEGGVTTDKIFGLVEELRKETDVPLAFMTYANVVYSYNYGGDEARKGVEGFAARCEETGIDGIILPDVPFEEKGEFAGIFEEKGVDFISLIAPTSEDRISMIAREAKGFIYVVSSLGVTGVRSEITTDIDAMVRLVREATDTPCAVGFGISTPQQAADMAGKSDGAIVGSAIMKIIAKEGKNAPEAVGRYVREMSAAVHGGH